MVARFDGNTITGETALNDIGYTNALSDLTGGGKDVVLADYGNGVVYVWR
jgi:hypothetical protein